MLRGQQGCPEWDGATGNEATASFSPTEAGEYTIKATCGKSVKAIKIVVVKLKSLSVSNASNTGLKSGNYGAVKGDGDVTLTAGLEPDVKAEAAYKLIRWDGGKIVKNHPEKRTVTKETSAKTTVEASCGGVTSSVNIWIVWSTLTIRFSGDKSPDNPVDFPPGWMVGKLGTFTKAKNGIDRDATGQMEACYLLTPKGLREVLSFDSAWSPPFANRKVVCNAFENGKSIPGKNDYDSGGWQGFSEKGKPGYDPEKYYEIDGPSPSPYPYFSHTFELYANFEQWLDWGDNERCSDIHKWHYRARVNADNPLAEQVELNDLGAGHVKLPSKAYYEVIKNKKEKGRKTK